MLRKFIFGTIFSLLSVPAVAQGINNPGPVNISTGVTGLGANVATFLSTPSSSNLAAALTDETGTGPAVFQAAPTFTGLVKFGEVGDQGFVRIWSSDATGTGSYTTITSDNTTLGRMVLTGGGGSASTVSEIGFASDALPTTDNIRALGTATNRWASADIAALNISGETQTLSNDAFKTCTALTTTNNVLGCTVSDRRMKTNIRPYAGNISDLFKNISPKVYSFKKGTPYFDNNRPRLGLIAQDVQKYLPEAVFPTGPGKPLQIDHAALDAAMFAEIKNLRLRVARLEGKK